MTHVSQGNITHTQTAAVLFRTIFLMVQSGCGCFFLVLQNINVWSHNLLTQLHDKLNFSTLTFENIDDLCLITVNRLTNSNHEMFQTFQNCSCYP